MIKTGVTKLDDVAMARLAMARLALAKAINKPSVTAPPLVVLFRLSWHH